VVTKVNAYSSFPQPLPIIFLLYGVGIRRMENEVGQLRIANTKPMLTPSTPHTSSSSTTSPMMMTGNTGSPHPGPSLSSHHPPSYMTSPLPPPPPPPSTAGGPVPAAGVQYTPAGSMTPHSHVPVGSMSGLSLALQQRNSATNGGVPINNNTSGGGISSGGHISHQYVMGSPASHTGSYIPASSVGRDSSLLLMHPSTRPPPIVTMNHHGSSSGGMIHHHRQPSMPMVYAPPYPPPSFASPITTPITTPSTVSSPTVASQHSGGGGAPSPDESTG
jgi:hypothetical protein